MLPSMYANFATNYAPTICVTLLQLRHRVFSAELFKSENDLSPGLQKRVFQLSCRLSYDYLSSQHCSV